VGGGGRRADEWGVRAYLELKVCGLFNGDGDNSILLILILALY
jgi:hypothetical protein